MGVTSESSDMVAADVVVVAECYCGDVSSDSVSVDYSVYESGGSSAGV